MAEAGIRLTDEVDAAETPVIKSPVPKRHPTIGTVVPGGNLAGLMDELNKRKSADGISAATGLKHVRGRGEKIFGEGNSSPALT